MNPIPSRLPKRRRLFSLLAVAWVFAVSTAPVRAQKPASESAQAPQEPAQTQVFRLQHAKAEAFQQLAQKLLGDEARIVAEPANNLVLVSAPGELMSAVTQLAEAFDVAKPEERTATLRKIEHGDAHRVASLLSQIVAGANVIADTRTESLIVSGELRDVRWALELAQLVDQPAARRETEPSEYKIIPLRHTPAQQMAELLASAGASEASEGVVLAVEPLSNSLLVSARRPESFLTVEGIVRRFDQPRPELQLRVVWLVSGMEDAREVPQDLEPVVGELEKIGLKNLGLASQMSLRSMSDEPIRMQSLVHLQKAPVLLSLDGTAKVDQANARIQLSVKVEFAGVPDASNSLSRIQTTIRTQLGHFVVLGVTPGGAYPSAFVVQVTEPK